MTRHFGIIIFLFCSIFCLSCTQWTFYRIDDNRFKKIKKESKDEPYEYLLIFEKFEISVAGGLFEKDMFKTWVKISNMNYDTLHFDPQRTKIIHNGNKYPLYDIIIKGRFIRNPMKLAIQKGEQKEFWLRHHFSDLKYVEPQSLTVDLGKFIGLADNDTITIRPFEFKRIGKEQVSNLFPSQPEK